MPTKQREKMKNEWKKMANSWSKFMPPGKPSIGEIRFFLNELKQLRQKTPNPKALILGATPEFRDMLSKMHISTTYVDINLNSKKAMTSLLKFRLNPREKFVLSDWLKMPFTNDSFDLVLSDSAQDNIKFVEFDSFFNEVFRILKPEGKWFFGAITMKKSEGQSLRKFIRTYKESPKTFREKKGYWLYQYFRLAYNKDFYDKKTKTTDFKKTDQAIAGLAAKEQLTKKDLDAICLGFDYQQPVLSENEFKKCLGKKFRTLAQYRDMRREEMKTKLTLVLSPIKKKR